MSLIIQKYGGTSVGDIERIKNVARRVIQDKKKGNDVVVVVSAMSGETDRLLKLAHQVLPNPNSRELDMIISTGEQVSIALLSLAIHLFGEKAESLTGAQVGIITDDAHGKARIKEIKQDRIFKVLKEGKIPIVAGFQGINANEDITTLGRGGSDTTAVAIAAALKADLCEIYTDVDGVYTTDPRIVPEARKLDRVSYDEMLEMASMGAKVLQIRSVVFAKKFNVPLSVRSSFNDNPGTLVIKEDRQMEEVLVSGITYDQDQSKITLLRLPDRPGIAAKIFSALSDNNIVVDMIIQNISEKGLTDLSFTVSRKEAKHALDFMSRMAEEIGAEDVSEDSSIAKISIVGVGMRNHSGIAAKMFSVLAKENINIKMISTSEIKISCIIDSKYTELAVRILHEAFNLRG